MADFAEEVTRHFYEWEYLGCGYHLFDEAVQLEPPYVPFFEHYPQSKDEYIDDGKVHNLFVKTFKVVQKLIAPKEEEPEETLKEFDIVDSKEHNLQGFSLSFSQEQRPKDHTHILELLNVLAYSKEKLAFEIVATASSMTIQIVCTQADYDKVKQHTKAYFPSAVITPLENVLNLPFDTNEEKTIAIADFGMNEEYMRPLAQANKTQLDPITPLITTLDNLQRGEIAIFQVLFKGVQAPWSNDIMYSVSDGRGGCFFWR